jgi:beta-1,2-mannobiose phosphorylase / 1,2-beta-oligomannan phosphorylase
MVATDPFRLERLGLIMAGDPADPDEAWGVLNPAACRGRDGELYLYPRVVAANNLSRVGIARVVFEEGEPRRVERLGYAMEPTEGFERNPRTAGVEDPRVTYVAAIDHYVMAYTAYGPVGPRVALALSPDGLTWRRLGPARFAYMPRYQTDFAMYTNKDAMIFPGPVIAPSGRLSLALLHRPDYNVAWWTEDGYHVPPTGIMEARPSIWISYVALDAVRSDLARLADWSEHHLLAGPEREWEALKIGGGTPPVLTSLGWLTIFHGVSGEIAPGEARQVGVRYAAGVLILDRDDPRTILYRSPTPVLAPDTEEEQHGIVDNVVFPTAVDVRAAGRIDVYYGMADARIGVARMEVPGTLPTT